MKPFNLAEYLKNPCRKIVTRDGWSARIICTDRKDTNAKPIVALVQTHVCVNEYTYTQEEIYSYTEDGLYIDKKIDIRDLFFAPERKQGWVNIFKHQDIRSCCRIFATQKEALRESGAVDYITTTKIEWEE